MIIRYPCLNSIVHKTGVTGVSSQYSTVFSSKQRRAIRDLNAMGNFIVNYKLDSLSDGVLDSVLHKTVSDIQEYVAKHAVISGMHGRPVLYRMQFKELFGFKNADTLFLTFDNDKDGKVDFFEVVCVLILCSRISPLAKMRLVFQLFDLDKCPKTGANTSLCYYFFMFDEWPWKAVPSKDTFQKRLSKACKSLVCQNLENWGRGKG